VVMMSLDLMKEIWLQELKWSMKDGGEENQMEDMEFSLLIMFNLIN